MRVAVITPYYKETTETLLRCHESVKAQTHADVTHYLVSDGHPNEVVDGLDCQHLRLPHAHGDFGDTPRVIGALSACAAGFDAICLLDADNWFETDHVSLMVEKHQETKADVITATRRLRRPDGSDLGICYESDGQNFCDTNCYFVTRAAFGAFGPWGFKDRRSAIVGDRVFWNTIKHTGFTLAHSMVPTVNYTTMFAVHYLQRKEEPPEGAKIIVTFQGQKYPTMLDYPEFVKLTTPQT